MAGPSGDKRKTIPMLNRVLAPISNMTGCVLCNHGITYPTRSNKTFVISEYSLKQGPLYEGNVADISYIEVPQYYRLQLLLT